MEKYDIVVVGLGPAGSSVAKTCAESGLNVLAIEKRQEIGVPVRCGEGLSKSALERMGLKPDAKWISQTIEGATVYAPNKRFVRIDYEGPEGWVIERKIFDKELAKQASRAGAKLLTKTEALSASRENGLVFVKIRHANEEKIIKTKILIACDGVESKLARMLGLDTTLKLLDITSCAQFEMNNIKIDPKRIELYFGSNIAGGGYAWIFPKGEDTANVGLGVRKPFAKDTAFNYLQRFVNSMSGLRNGSIIEFNSGGVPVGGLLKNMVADNLMVVGDAAHQVNPIHGGGISEAYIAGKIAGEIVVEAMKAKDFSKNFLDNYNKIWWRERGDKLQKLVKLRQVAESLSDDELNWLADYLTGEDLVNFSHSSGFKRLATILMHKPKLIKIARKLL